MGIPHRYPFLLVDRIEEINSTLSCVGIKNVTINEPFFPGHFPGHPIMPGVLIIEAMAQTASALVVHGYDGDTSDLSVYLMKVDNALEWASLPPTRTTSHNSHGATT